MKFNFLFLSEHPSQNPFLLTIKLHNEEGVGGVTRHVVPHTIRRDGGRVVSLSSPHGNAVLLPSAVGLVVLKVVELVVDLLSP